MSWPRLAILTVLLGVLLAGGAAVPAAAQHAGHEAPAAPAAPAPSAASLYERLGGHRALAAAIDDFLAGLDTDPTLARFFVGHSRDSRQRIRQLMLDQLCALTGGPCLYRGRSMRTAHAGLGIREDDWLLTLSHFGSSLEKVGVGAREKEETLAALARLKDEIVEPAAAAGEAPGAFAWSAVGECLAKDPHGGDCLDRLVEEFLRGHSLAELLALVQKREASDPGFRLSCHVVVHAIGREAFRLKGTVHDALGACDQTCHSGCYHGVLERFLGAASGHAGHHGGGVDPALLEARAAQACDPGVPRRLLFQCLHGLGHAVMFFSDYRLKTALGICDRLPDGWSQRSCYGGVFMENLFAAVPDKRDVNPSDFHYPCDAVEPKYRGECYLIQTWRMWEMGLTTEQLFEQCRTVVGFQTECAQSIGRDLSIDVRSGGPRPAAQKCESGQGDASRACIRGVVYALIDTTWDGRYALPFCGALRAEDDVRYCFDLGVRYLSQTFAKPAEEIRSECLTHLARPDGCLDAARR
jgi:hemoglobin